MNKDICILCPLDKLEVVKDRAKGLFGEKILVIEVGPDEHTPTYRFCHMRVTESMQDLLFRIRKDSIMEEADPNEFLVSKGLVKCVKVSS